MPPPGPDDTVRLPPSRPPPPPATPAARGGRSALIAAGLVVALAGAAGLAFLPGLWRPTPVAVVPPAPEPVPAPPAAPAVAPPGIPPALAAIPLADEAAILAHRGERLAMFRLAPNPAVLVLDFPTLIEQGTMLNRIAALVEKAGLPRDRVLDDAALASAIREGGGTPETFYYGHNYRAADLRRFFTLAARDGIALNGGEQRLHALLRDIGWLEEGISGALVSVPQTGVEPWLDQRARAAMLRHELSHGEFFTNAAYADRVLHFWRDMLTGPERDRFRTLLAEASYDPGIEEVMANEAHAFLFHTPDERFFSPASFGFSAARLAELRSAFRAGLPPGWMQDAMERDR